MEVKNVRISGINSEGFGVGRSEDFTKVLFVKNAVMEEVVSVKITKEEKSFCFAEVLETLQNSKFRTSPKCMHFGVCGGCSIQHLTREGQLEVKQKQVQDAITRIAKLSPKIERIIHNEQDFEYRNKMDFAFSELAWITNEEENKERRVLGIHTFGRFDRVLNIKECHLSDKKINSVRNFVWEFCIKRNTSFWNQKTKKGMMRDLIFRVNSKGELLLIIIFGEQPKVLQADLCMALKSNFPEIASLYWGVNKKESDFIYETKLYGFIGEEFLHQKLLDLMFKVSLKSFAQVNSKMAEKLISKVLEVSDLKETDIVYDLYSGIGTLSLHFAKKVQKVIGIEVSGSSINDARENAIYNEIKNVKFFKSKVEDILSEGFIIENGNPNVIVVDPPRNGIEKSALEKILQTGSEKLIYISCNPASFARDSAILKEKYELKTVIPLDMFPQTTHVELVSIFKKL